MRAKVPVRCGAGRKAEGTAGAKVKLQRGGRAGLHRHAELWGGAGVFTEGTGQSGEVLGLEKQIKGFYYKNKT